MFQRHSLAPPPQAASSRTQASYAPPPDAVVCTIRLRCPSPGLRRGQGACGARRRALRARRPPEQCSALR
eukprot:3900441-Rhodomonas_salina.2